MHIKHSIIGGEFIDSDSESLICYFNIESKYRRDSEAGEPHNFN